MQNLNFSKWIIKIDRSAAWILLASIILYFISGYGMAKGFLNYKTASTIHSNILPFVTLPALALHTFSAIRLALIRWRMYSTFVLIGLISVYIIAMLSFLYLQLFYSQTPQEGGTAYVTNGSETITTNNTDQKENPEKQASGKSLTASELAQYDGQNGKSAYVAVDGIVYDVTSVFTNGTHYEHLAGQELTNAFYKKHVTSEITKYPIIGTFSE